MSKLEIIGGLALLALAVFGLSLSNDKSGKLIEDDGIDYDSDDYKAGYEDAERHCESY